MSRVLPASAALVFAALAACAPGRAAPGTGNPATRLAEPGCAPVPDREALAEVLRRARQLHARGAEPLAIFDLDGTLTDPDPRTLGILSDALAGDLRPEAERARRRIAARSRAGAAPPLPYDIRDVLGSLGIEGPLAEELRERWLARFFTGEALARDAAIPGAPAFVRRLRAEGVRVVYLTGRCRGTTEVGTRDSLRALGFPLDGDTPGAGGAELRMKPGRTRAECEAVADRAFKASVLDSLAPGAVVVGVFENEPANLRDLAARFDGAVPVFVVSSHAPRAPAVPGGARCIVDYTWP